LSDEAIWDNNNNKPLNRSTQNLKEVITSARRPPLQNFVQIRPLGASWQVGEI